MTSHSALCLHGHCLPGPAELPKPHIPGIPANPPHQKFLEKVVSGRLQNGLH